MFGALDIGFLDLDHNPALGAFVAFQGQHVENEELSTYADKLPKDIVELIWRPTESR
jgi:hypothetical protein